MNRDDLGFQPRPGQRQLVKFTFFKVAPEWRRLDGESGNARSPSWPRSSSHGRDEIWFAATRRWERAATLTS